MTQDSSSGDSIETGSQVIDSVTALSDIPSAETVKEAEKDTLGILEFYKTHDMDSLSQHFDTIESTDYINS